MHSARAVLRATGAVALIILVAGSLIGCGGPEPPANARDLAQAVSLDYVAGAPTNDVRSVSVAQGKVVSVTVSSDVAGDVRIEGVNVTRPVQAGGSTVLIFSANEPGVFDVRLRGDGVNVLLGQLEVEEE